MKMTPWGAEGKGVPLRRADGAAEPQDTFIAPPSRLQGPSTLGAENRGSFPAPPFTAHTKHSSKGWRTPRGALRKPAGGPWCTHQPAPGPRQGWGRGMSRKGSGSPAHPAQGRQSQSLHLVFLVNNSSGFCSEDSFPEHNNFHLLLAITPCFWLNIRHNEPPG